MRNHSRQWVLTVSDELKRLTAGPDAGEVPQNSLLVELQATSISPGGSVLLPRIKEVLRIVIGSTNATWPEVEDWRELLPGWFVNACAEEESPEESAAWLTWWRALGSEERGEAARNRPWSLADWLHWLRPDERQWYWWDALVDEDDSLHIVVVVDGWPSPLGALEWLAKAAGADVIEVGAPSNPR